MGYQVVKHGNRAVSSKCGSADALEGLGVNLDVNPAEVGKILHDQNFVFLFAQRFHPCFRNIAPIRNELGIRTLFNLLGPLINPSRPTHILLGVAPAQSREAHGRNAGPVFPYTGPPWFAGRAAMTK